MIFLFVHWWLRDILMVACDEWSSESGGKGKESLESFELFDFEGVSIVANDEREKEE